MSEPLIHGHWDHGYESDLNRIDRAATETTGALTWDSTRVAGLGCDGDATRGRILLDLPTLEVTWPAERTDRLPMMGLDADLIAYYDAEARAGLRIEHAPMRVSLRQRFTEQLQHEQRRHLVDVGAGPGLDTIEFHTDGFDIVGVDIAPANAEAIHEHGLAGVAGSLYALPFPAATFDALWTMSTFVHIPHDRFDEAITELLRVVTPGAPLAIGTWGGRDFEGIPEFGELRPYRFFSLASHDRWRTMLEHHGHLEHFETFPPTQPSGWEYQYAILRAEC